MRRQAYHCILAALMSLALLTLLLWLSAGEQARADANVYCVNQTGTGCDGVCGGGCYGSVQAAIDAASSGGEIRIAAGTYAPDGTVAAITKELALHGGYDPTCAGFDPDLYQTVLDAQWGGSVISITNAGEVVLQHLTLTHGDGRNNCGAWAGCGGGVYVKDTAIHIGQCVITGNVGSGAQSAFGGGIYVDNNAPAEIWENQIVNNTASTAGVGWGGGLYLEGGTAGDRAVVTGNTFEGNVGSTSTSGDGQGGGIYLQRYAILSHNLLRQNYGGRGAVSGCGGGLYMWEVWGADLEGNRFLNNTASESGSYGFGGAIYGSASVAFTMTNNLLAENNARSAGGGLWLDTWAPSYLIAGTLVNNTLADNDAGAGGEGIWVGRYVSLTLTNNIIAGHTVGITNTRPASSTVSANTNLFWNSSDPITGSNAILADPLLSADYHLRSGSPAVDAGLTIPWLTADLEGNPRPQGSGYDLGAYEGERNELFLPLILR
ncbi:MAG: choice-of-anchor Q domain-containing protein [Anaerolineae bacterium]